MGSAKKKPIPDDAFPHQVKIKSWAFDPQPDITTFELAQCMLGCFNNTLWSWQQMEEHIVKHNLTRHFKENKLNPLVQMALKG